MAAVVAHSPADIAAIDPWYWADFNKIKLVGGRFSLADHEYQLEMFQDNPKKECWKKATQMGFTEIQVLKTLHGLIYHTFPRGVLYLFPTGDDVTDFSSSRFQPLINDNRATVGKHVKDTNRENLKRVGDAFLFFRGARMTQTIDNQRRSASRLKGIPVDKVVFDELDEMDPGAVPLALARMKHSYIQQEIYIANPTIPDFGIDALYQESDQRVWIIRCKKCGKETCLELEFPDCLERTADDNVIRLCIHCRDQELYPRDGRWVPQYPDRSKDLIGRWIGQLNSAFVPPKDLLDAFENPKTDKTHFNNLGLGLAYIDAESRLQKNQVFACCGFEPMAPNSRFENAMGVDVGKKLHVLIGHKVNAHTAKVVKLARVSSFNDLDDLAKRYNVRCAVLDLYPEERKVRAFVKSQPYAAFGCDYLEEKRGPAKFNYKEDHVRVNRTEICDDSHDLVASGYRLELPRKSEEIIDYAKEMTNVAKILKEDKQSGRMVYHYKKLGPDHYRHATNYFLLALKKVGIYQVAEDEEDYSHYEEEDYQGRSAETGY